MTAATFSIIALSIISLPLVSSVPLNKGKGRTTEIAYGTAVDFAFAKKSYPFMARIILDGSFKCGGALISDRFVATARHCLEFCPCFNEANPSNDWTRCNKLCFLKLRENSDFISDTETVHTIKTIHLPEKGGKPYERTDFALIELAESANTCTQEEIAQVRCWPVTPVRLPDPAIQIKEGQRVRTLGWGATEFSFGDEQSEFLAQLDITVNSSTLYHLFIETNIGPNGADPCKGDSGGPLLLRGDDLEWTLVGTLVGGGYQCENPEGEDTTSDWSKVALHVPWITSVMGTTTVDKPVTSVTAMDEPVTSVTTVVEPVLTTSWVQGCSETFSLGNKACGTRAFTKADHLKYAEASPGEFPWICLLLTSNDTFIGSCAIIPSNFSNDNTKPTRKIITNVNLLDNLRASDLLNVKVRVGEHDARGFKYPEVRDYTEYTVKRILKHPDFGRKLLTNNLAILYVDRNINLNHPYVNTACLPSCDDQFDFEFSNGTGVRCWAAGWGKDVFDGEYQFIPRKVDLPLVDNVACEASLKYAFKTRRSKLANSFQLHASQMCAGGEIGKDTCGGDGGSPLVCQAQSGRWTAMGLVNWGLGCGDGVPSVYSRISYFRNWINNN